MFINEIYIELYISTHLYRKLVQCLEHKKYRVKMTELLNESRIEIFYRADPFQLKSTQSYFQSNLHFDCNM